MSAVVGIDLGTTWSVVAHVDARGVPRSIANAHGEVTTPSVVAWEDGRVVVGKEARLLQKQGHEDAVAFFKRAMGDREWAWPAAGRTWTPVDLSALVLGTLKRDAEAFLGEPVTRAVITVPAYFKNPQREATLAAAKAAGLEVLQLVNEPTAAAIAYGCLQQGPPKQTLLVYDLGGGTFDVTLLRRDANKLAILSSDGDHALGGKDWDDRIVDFVASRFQAETGVDPLEDRAGFNDLFVEVEEKKRQLSTLDQVTLSIQANGRAGRYVLDRGTFAALTRDLLERTRVLTTRVLEERGVRPQEVDGIVLVGGSTRMPMVHAYVEQAFGRPALKGVNVDEAVALGAAILAAQCRHPQELAVGIAGRVRAVDVTNHSLGMIALNADRSAYVNSIILPKNRPLPCTERRPYVARVRKGRTTDIEVYVTQGEVDRPGDVEYLGCYVLRDVPHTGDTGTAIDVAYSYGASGTVEVAASVRATGTPLAVEVRPLPGDVPARFLGPPPVAPVAEHLTVYLAFDLSGSMCGTPLATAQAAARRFLGEIDLSGASVGVIGFADSTQTALAASQNARDIERALGELPTLEVGGGNRTDPFDEVYARLSGVRGRRVAVVLADGVWSNQGTAEARAKRCHENGIDVVSVGFGSADKGFLRRIASADEAMFFTGLDGLASTFGNIAQVLTETGGMSPMLDAPGAAAAPKRGGWLSFLGGKPG